MGANTLTLRRETERQRDIEALERFHLTVEPCLRAIAQTVSPAQPCPNVSHTERLQPPHRIIQAMILEVKPLTDPEGGRQA
jgi:hypothetical protein